MATRTFANLAPFVSQAAVVNPLDALLQGVQQGVQLRQLPQQIQQDALNQQLQQALQRAKLAELAQGKTFEVGGSLVRQDPLTGEFKPVFTSTTAAINKPIEMGSELVQLNPATGKYESVFKSETAQKSPFSQQQVVSLTDPADVRFAIPDASGLPPAGYQFSKAIEQPMKPSEKITAIKEVRAVYDDLPSKMQVFGGGQIIGANQLKEDLDALLKPVNGDFSKLSPQALKTFVFRANNLNDPRSATLLAEASQIASRAGIGDRFDAYVKNLKTGADVPPSVAQDIYNIISQVQSSREERLINDLIPLKDDLESLGKKLTSIGVPKRIEDEVERRIANPQASTISNTTTVTTPPVQIKTKAERDALPVGTKYIGPDGKPATR